MALTKIVEKLDEVDMDIREVLKAADTSLGERAALEQARELIQQAITPILKYLL